MAKDIKKENFEERFDEKFGQEFAMNNVGSYFEDRIKVFIKKEKEKSKLEILDIVDNLITKEIVIAQKEGEKTSRLTSFSVTLKKGIIK